jgi:hypothetical protein
MAMMSGEGLRCSLNLCINSHLAATAADSDEQRDPSRRTIAQGQCLCKCNGNTDDGDSGLPMEVGLKYGAMERDEPLSQILIKIKMHHAAGIPDPTAASDYKFKIEKARINELTKNRNIIFNSILRLCIYIYI